MKGLIIIGNGGHKKVVLDVAIELGYELRGIIDDSIESYQDIDGIYYGNRSHLRQMMTQTNSKLFFGIGNNHVRKKIVEESQLKENDFITLVSPKAIVSKSVHIDIGTLVMPGCVINADASIGKQVIVNTCSVIEHDCIVENYCHISPNSTLTGAVKVSEGTQIGAGSVVNPGLTIGSWTLIGSGASVVNDIDSNVVAKGIPAKVSQ